MDTLVLGHLVWHDTGGGCHSSSAPSGLVALSREHRRWGNLLTTYCKMTWQKCPVENPAVKAVGDKENKKIIAESSEEHLVVKHLMEEMRALAPSDEQYAPKFTVLTENVPPTI